VTLRNTLHLLAVTQHKFESGLNKMHFEYACSQQGPLRTPFERHCTNLFSPTFSSSLRYLIHLLKPVPCPMHLQSVPCLQCHYQLVLCQWTHGRQVLMTYRHHQLVPCYCQHLGMSTVEEGLEQLVPATLLTGNYSIQTTHAAMLCYVTLRYVKLQCVRSTTSRELAWITSCSQNELVANSCC